MLSLPSALAEASDRRLLQSNDVLKPRVPESKTFSKSGAEFHRLPKFSKTTAKIPKPPQFRKPTAEDFKPPRPPKFTTGDGALSKVRVANAAKLASGKKTEDFGYRPPGAAASTKTRASFPREMDPAKASGTNTGKHIAKDEELATTTNAGVDKSTRTHKSKDILGQAANANGLWKMPTDKDARLNHSTHAQWQTGGHGKASPRHIWVV
ncbi:hypothetical protein CYMTET_36889 [Cymbomonas tetramitiformis]|uniref:Uncharacterized protein n=1 Tax=Cymbomonas tetramitiformis TaxID=36881 RepID=A0AAE0CGH1_9CHLO|nr:hypothetical protein CYMTET_36889 [Cymbomonas tetramitiformis]